MTEQGMEVAELAAAIETVQRILQQEPGMLTYGEETALATVLSALNSTQGRVAELEGEREQGQPVTDVDAIEDYPVGTILLEQIARHSGQAMAWRKERDGWWYPSTFSWVRQRGALAMAGAKPIPIHTPPAAAPDHAEGNEQ